MISFLLLHHLDRGPSSGVFGCICAMELPSVHARSGDRPQEVDLLSHDGTLAPDMRHTRGVAPDTGQTRPDRAARPGDDEAGAAPRSAAEHETLTVPGDAQRLPDRPPTRLDLGRQRLAERLEGVENPASNRSDLRERLKDLLPGHPSSPRKEDGSPRPPTPRLADLERLNPPLSDAAYIAHIA